MQPSIERRRPPPRRPPVSGLGDSGAVGRLACEARRLLELCLERSRLGMKRRSPTLELEEHGFRRLAHEPELTCDRVVAEALRRHGRDRYVEQRLERHDRVLANELLWRATGEHRQAAETGRPRPLEQREPERRVVREDRGRTRAQRRGDSALATWLDVDRRESESCSILRERSCCGRKPFLLGQCLVEGPYTFLHELGALGARNPLAFRVS